MKLTDERIYELADSDRCNPDNSGWGPKFSPLEFARAIEAEVLRITGDRRGEAVAWHQQDAVPSITPPQQEQAAPVQDGWMPIETAPKDGTWILVMRAGDDAAYVATWLEYEGNPVLDADGEEGYMFGWVFRNPYLHAGGHEEGFLGWDDDPLPTHWMPLPAAPKQEPGT